VKYIRENLLSNDAFGKPAPAARAGA